MQSKTAPLMAVRPRELPAGAVVFSEADGKLWVNVDHRPKALAGRVSVDELVDEIVHAPELAVHAVTVLPELPPGRWRRLVPGEAALSGPGRRTRSAQILEVKVA